MSEVRRIDVAGEEPVTPVDQPAPTLLWVDVAELRIDPRYQRPLARANWLAIRRIAANFRWSRFGAVQVAPLPGGGFAVVDGQHRAHAAAICGFDKVPALVVPMDMAEQASAFAWVNGNTVKMTPLHVYRAALAAGDAWAVKAEAAVRAAGCVLMTSARSQKDKKAGEVYAVQLIRGMIEAGEGAAVTAGLGALRRCAEADMPELWSAHLLKPWLTVLASSTRLMRADLDGFLAEESLIEMLDRADQGVLAARRSGGAGTRVTILQAMIESRLRTFVERAAAA